MDRLKLYDRWPYSPSDHASIELVEANLRRQANEVIACVETPVQPLSRAALPAKAEGVIRWNGLRQTFVRL